jgi:hypothetical protein
MRDIESAAPSGPKLFLLWNRLKMMLPSVIFFVTSAVEAAGRGSRTAK